MTKFYNLEDEEVELDDETPYFLIHQDFINSTPIRSTLPRILGKDVPARIEQLAKGGERWVNPEKVYVEDATSYDERIKTKLVKMIVEINYQGEKICLEDLTKLPEGKYFIRNRLLEQGEEQPINRDNVVDYVIKLTGEIKKKAETSDVEEIVIAGPMGIGL